jgi:hypothetical protein
MERILPKQVYINFEATRKMAGKGRDSGYLTGIAIYFGMRFVATVPEIATKLKVTPRTVYGFLSRNDGGAITVIRRAAQDGGTLPSEYVLNTDFIRLDMEEDGQS